MTHISDLLFNTLGFMQSRLIRSNDHDARSNNQNLNNIKRSHLSLHAPTINRSNQRHPSQNSPHKQIIRMQQIAGEGRALLLASAEGSVLAMRVEQPGLLQTIGSIVRNEGMRYVSPFYLTFCAR